MHTADHALEALLQPGRGVLVVDEYADRVVRGRCLTAQVADDLVLRALEPDLMGPALAGLLLDKGRLAAMRSDGAPVGEALLGVRIDGFAERTTPADQAATAVDLGAVFAEVHANRRPAWRDPGLGHVAVEPIALTTRAVQQHGLVPVVGLALHGLDDGSLGITRAVTVNGLKPAMAALDAVGVDLSRCVLRLPLIGPGAVAGQDVTAGDVATATLDALDEVLAAEVAAVWFHSAGHDLPTVAAWLRAIAALAETRAVPWRIGFAVGRAVVSPAADAWATSGPDQGRRALASACHTLSRSLRPAAVH